MTGKLTQLVNKILNKGISKAGRDHKDLLNKGRGYEQDESGFRNPHHIRDTLPTLEPVGDMYPQDIEKERDQKKVSEIAQRMNQSLNKTDNQLYDPSMTNQPVYETDQTQIINDIAADESVPALIHNISSLSRLGVKAKARLIARTIAFQSKDQVFSNIINLSDYQAAQDDFEYAQILSKGDFTAFDVNSDYFTAEAIMEAKFNIRLRRSRNALNLQQINTQRQEQVYSQQHHNQEERKLRNRIPFIGGGGGL